jgi:hypothetical protein
MTAFGQKQAFENAAVSSFQCVPSLWKTVAKEILYIRLDRSDVHLRPSTDWTATLKPNIHYV